MSSPARIGDREVAADLPRGSGPKTSMGERMGAALASPLGVLIVIPGLVVALGAFLTLIGQRALIDSSVEVGRDRIREQTGFIARSVAAALDNADPTLDRMHEIALERDLATEAAPIAHALAGLIRNRPGMSYASISYPDGRFGGSYLDADGALRYQESWLAGDHTEVRRYDLDGTDRLKPHDEAETHYDPRVREFYRVAIEKKVRSWTKPYPFFENHYTGVTRCEPVYVRGELRAVLTADFDVSALSASIERVPLPGAKTLLYTRREGTILAYPEGAATIPTLKMRLDQALTVKDLGDPTITAFFQQVTGAPPSAGEFVTFDGPTSPELAMVADVPRYPDLGWSAAAIIPEPVFFRAQRLHERQSLAAAALALGVSIAVSLVFARHVVKVRRDMARAEGIAREATARAKELGSYRLVERLGVGGMGEVWRAEHRLLARHAAIKLIRPEALKSAALGPDELRERFRIEAQTLAMLRSRHTIELFDYGVTEEGTFFFVMELLDGIDLDTLVANHGPQPPARVIAFLLQACRSLGEAHAAGLVHRDIKPANLFVCRAADEVDVMKVLDFGLVHTETRTERPSLPIKGLDAEAAATRLTQAGQYMGTPAFMAPEQGLGQHVDGRADLYALGCAAVWLLSGQLVYEAPDNLAMIMAHLTQPIPELASLLPAPIPEGLARAILHCLQKSKDDRPQSAEALAEALNAIELAPGEEWTDAAAKAWWSAHMKQKVAASPSDETAAHGRTLTI